MKIEFDRQDYLALEEIFEVGQLDDVTLELSEFSDDIEDMAYELAYTRYELAKAEARHNALVEAVKKEHLAFDALDDAGFQLGPVGSPIWADHAAARAEVGRLLVGEEGK